MSPRRPRNPSSVRTLPPGQQARPDFPRFGVPAYAGRLAKAAHGWQLMVGNDDGSTSPVPDEDFRTLGRREIVADFHCVTTWSHCDLRWGGYCFRDFYEKICLPRAPGLAAYRYIEVKALDGPRVRILLEDLLQDGVLLADQLHGEALPVKHGAPLRLVAPHLYGYKNVKHVSEIRLVSEFRASLAERQTLAHPRGRVDFEERGRWLPGPFYRYLYRAFIPATLWYFRLLEQRRNSRQLP